MGIELEKLLMKVPEIKIKELIIISIENGRNNNSINTNLDLAHKYLFIFRLNRRDSNAVERIKK